MEVRFASPCVVSGKFTINEDVAVEKKESKKTKWRILLANKEYPKIILSISEAEGGRYKSFLQPGKYIPYLTRVGNCIPLEEITVTGKEKEKALDPIVVTKEMWSKKKSEFVQGIR